MIKIRTSSDGNRFGVFSNDPYIHKICKTIPGYKYDDFAKAYVWPASPINASLIRSVISNPDVKVDAAFNVFLQQGEDAYREAQRIQHEERTELTPPPIYNKEHPLWQHQLRAFNFVVSLWGGLGQDSHGGGAMIPLKMGRGKSKCAIYLIANYGFGKVLIACPSKVVQVWSQQFEEHDPIGCKVLALRHGSTKKRAQQARDHLQLCEDKYPSCPAVIILNYEAARVGFLAELTLKTQWDCAILDESHRCKSPQAQTSRWAGLLGRRAKYRLALTGTPMHGSPLDLFSQYRFLDISIFGASFTKFRSQFAQMGGFMNHQVVGYHNQDELHRKFYTIAYQMKPEEDVVARTEPLHIYRRAKIGRGEKIYWQMYHNLVAQVKDGVATAGNALVKLLRLQQITGGHLKDEDGTIHKVDDAKAELLADIFLDLDISEPIVIFCRFHPDMDVCKKVCEESGRTFSELSGREDTLKDWLDGKTDVLISQISSGKEGISLVRAQYTIYFSLGFSLGDFDQSVARTDRPGQAAYQVTCIHLLLENTVDEQVYKAIKERRDVIKSVLEDMKDS